MSVRSSIISPRPISEGNLSTRCAYRIVALDIKARAGSTDIFRPDPEQPIHSPFASRRKILCPSTMLILRQSKPARLERPHHINWSSCMYSGPSHRKPYGVPLNFPFSTSCIYRRFPPPNGRKTGQKLECATILRLFRRNPVVVYAIKRAPYRVSCSGRTYRFAGPAVRLSILIPRRRRDG
jgi:hypothetical protein